MNNDRRKALRVVLNSLNEALETVTDCKEDEESAYDSLPEGIQDSERGEAMSDAMDYLDSACDSIDEAISSINDAIDV